MSKRCKSGEHPTPSKSRLAGELGLSLCALWVEGAAVVALRSWRIARGGAQGAAEARLMVSEKMAAQRHLAAELAAGRLGADALSITHGTMRYVVKGVRDNRRRLLRR